MKADRHAYKHTCMVAGHPDTHTYTQNKTKQNAHTPTQQDGLHQVGLVALCLHPAAQAGGEVEARRGCRGRRRRLACGRAGRAHQAGELGGLVGIPENISKMPGGCQQIPGGLWHELGSTGAHDAPAPCTSRAAPAPALTRVRSCAAQHGGQAVWISYHLRVRAHERPEARPAPHRHRHAEAVRAEARGQGAARVSVG